MTDVSAENPTRAQLAEVFKEPRTRQAMENLFAQANGDLPGQVAAALLAAENAQAEADALRIPEYIVAVLSGTIPNARHLTGDTGVTIDVSVAAVAKIVVNALAILNAAAIVLTQNVSTSGTLAVTGLTSANGGLKVTGQTKTDSLRIDASPTTAAIVQTDWIPISVNGTPYKLLLGT